MKSFRYSLQFGFTFAVSASLYPKPPSGSAAVVLFFQPGKTLTEVFVVFRDSHHFIKYAASTSILTLGYSCKGEGLKAIPSSLTE